MMREKIKNYEFKQVTDSSDKKGWGNCDPGCDPGDHCDPSCDPNYEACDPCSPSCDPGNCEPICNPECDPYCDPRCSPWHGNK